MFDFLHFPLMKVLSINALRITNATATTTRMATAATTTIKVVPPARANSSPTKTQTDAGEKDKIIDCGWGMWSRSGKLIMFCLKNVAFDAGICLRRFRTHYQKSVTHGNLEVAQNKACLCAHGRLSLHRNSPYDRTNFENEVFTCNVFRNKVQLI